MFAFIYLYHLCISVAETIFRSCLATGRQAVNSTFTGNYAVSGLATGLSSSYGFNFETITYAEKMELTAKYENALWTRGNRRLVSTILSHTVSTGLASVIGQAAVAWLLGWSCDEVR